MQQICSCSSKSTNQCTAFLQHATNVFVAWQVDWARWNTRNIDPKVATTSRGFFYLVFRRLYYSFSQIQLRALQLPAYHTSVLVGRAKMIQVTLRRNENNFSTSNALNHYSIPSNTSKIRSNTCLSLGPKKIRKKRTKFRIYWCLVTILLLTPRRTKSCQNTLM